MSIRPERNRGRSKIISWRVVVNAGISGSDIRDLLLEAVERRFSALRAPAVIEVLTDNVLRRKICAA